MPVIGLSLAVVPIVAILAVRALLKLALMPVRGVYAYARNKPRRALPVIALCGLGLFAVSQAGSGGGASVTKAFALVATR